MPVEDPQAGQEFRDDSEVTFTCRRCGTEFSGDACPACGLLVAEAQCGLHPDRPAHSRCVICGQAVCAECCDPDRSVALCPAHQSVPVIEGWAQVYSTADEVEAGLLAENLRSEGIDAQVYSQHDHIFPVDLGELSIARLLVPVWEYANALQLIRDYMDSKGEVNFACPACGEVYEPGQDVCGSCGAVLTA